MGSALALTATSGTAAFNIGGSTIHRSVKMQCKKQINGTLRRSLQDEHKHTQYFCIDEMSMLSLQNLVKIIFILKL